jgi:hypothetical protein
MKLVLFSVIFYADSEYHVCFECKPSFNSEKVEISVTFEHNPMHRLEKLNSSAKQGNFEEKLFIGLKRGSRGI